MRLFVDTSAWVAYYDAKDCYHMTAKEALATLINQPLSLITTDYVLDETITLLLYHAGREHALAFVEAVLHSNNVQLIYIDAALWSQAWQFFKQYEDKTWAFTDCTSFIVMRTLQLSQAFAFDHHFEQAGFQLWPQGL